MVGHSGFISGEKIAFFFVKYTFWWHVVYEVDVIFIVLVVIVISISIPAVGSIT